jgi:dTDP-glucose pyrophosphorylase
MNILIPMAGEGKRFKDGNILTPKPLISIFDKPMAIHAIESLGVNGSLIVVVQNNAVGHEIEQVIKQHFPETKVCYSEGLTEGPACSALLAKDHICNDQPLIITNCDQILTWDGQAFNSFLQCVNYDGLIVTYTTQKPINSYAKLNRQGLVVEIKEKEVISDISLNGIHYWKKGADFICSAETMIANEDRCINGEYYIGPTYNYLIKEGKKIGIYHIPSCQHHAVGVPEDLQRFLKHAEI